jgi:hypothetical protein
MTVADDAILSKLSRYVLDLEVVEGAIGDALAVLQPSGEILESRRAALATDIRRLEDEPARLVAAIAIAGQVDALPEALPRGGPGCRRSASTICAGHLRRARRPPATR